MGCGQERFLELRTGDAQLRHVIGLMTLMPFGMKVLSPQLTTWRPEAHVQFAAAQIEAAVHEEVQQLPVRPEPVVAARAVARDGVTAWSRYAKS